MTKNRLSIIIPVFNERDRIIKLVDFLLKNSGSNLLEIVVVDAANSADDLLDIEIPNQVVIVKAAETCRASQLQMGAEKSKGDWLYFLHADTFPPKDYANQIKQCLESHDFGMFNYQFDRRQWNFKFNGWMTQWKAFYTGGGDQGLFLPKDSFQKIGGFDTNLSIMEDYDLFWRLKKENFKYQIVKSPALVSARKYERNNGLKVNIVNLVTLLGFKFTGNGPKWTRFYKKHIK